MSEPESTPFVKRVMRVAPIAFATSLALVVGYYAVVAEPDSQSKSAPEGVATSPSPAPSAAPRCAPRAAPFAIGEAPSKPNPTLSTAESATGGPVESEEPFEPDELAPFAVEVGRAVATPAGFAVGVNHAGEGGTIGEIALIEEPLGGPADPLRGKLVRLARSRGDLEPPIVTAGDEAIFAGLVEPNAGGRSIRVARVSRLDASVPEVAWGPTFAEGRDESLAFDLAVARGKGVIVWDDVSRDRERSVVVLAGFDSSTMRDTLAARPVSPPSADAEAPRLSVRDGGFWLAYVVRRELSAIQPKRKPEEGRKRSSEVDEEKGGEIIDASWIELVPLDTEGLPSGAPRAVTPKDGHVLGFDLEPRAGGSVLIAWRDNDTPSGSSGGRVLSATAGMSGVSEPVVWSDEDRGAGPPEVTPKWVAITDALGPTRLAPLDEHGALAGETRAEALLGSGEVLAGRGDDLLVARSAGRAMRLQWVRCVETSPADAGAPRTDASASAP